MLSRIGRVFGGLGAETQSGCTSDLEGALGCGLDTRSMIATEFGSPALVNLEYTRVVCVSS